MPLDKEEYIKQFGHDKLLDDDAFWKKCESIFDDYEKYKEDNKNTPSSHLNDLMNLEKVHSVRYRFKDSYHLINKVIRKGYNNKEELTTSNYKEKIQDLIGFRILHLFKTDWIHIHNQIIEKWNIVGGKAEAYYRKGDNSENFNAVENLEPKQHPRGYRSIHYIVETKPHRQPILFEFQLRTIFEEAWAEVDHTVCYPNNTDNFILSPYMMMLNGLAGISDEMSTNAMLIRKYINQTEHQINNLQSDKDKAYQELEENLEKLPISNEEKEPLKGIVNNLKEKSSWIEVGNNPLHKLLHGVVEEGFGEAFLKQIYQFQSNAAEASKAWNEKVAATQKAFEAALAPVIQQASASQLVFEAALAPVIQQASASQLALKALTNQISKLSSDSQKDVAE